MVRRRRRRRPKNTTGCRRCVCGVEFAARRLASPRRGASLAKTGAVFAQHPAGGRAGGLNERPSIKTAREPNAAPDETPLSEMAPMEYSVSTSKTQCELGGISTVLESLFEDV